MKLTLEEIEFLDDLRIKSMLFDMDIDLETLELVEKQVDTTPQWLINWKEKKDGADNDPSDPEQAWA